MKGNQKKKKEVLHFDSKKAFIHSANKLNRSMSEVSRGCGLIGDQKYNRSKNKRSVQRELKNDNGADLFICYDLVRFIDEEFFGYIKSYWVIS